MSVWFDCNWRKTGFLFYSSFPVCLSFSFVVFSFYFHLHSFPLNFFLLDLLAWRRVFQFCFFLPISFSINDLCECVRARAFLTKCKNVYNGIKLGRGNQRKNVRILSVSAANRQKTPEENAANCLRLSISHSSCNRIFCHISLSTNGINGRKMKRKRRCTRCESVYSLRSLLIFDVFDLPLLVPACVPACCGLVGSVCLTVPQCVRAIKQSNKRRQRSLNIFWLHRCHSA